MAAVLAWFELSLALAGGAATYFVFSYTPPPHRVSSEATESHKRKLFAAFVFFLVAVSLIASVRLLGDDPWIPAERIELARQAQIIGYVVAYDDAWVTVLREEDRRIMRLRPADIVGRTLCRAHDGFSGRSALATLTHLTKPRYPKCAPER